jgi:hypothetical protein
MLDEGLSPEEAVEQLWSREFMAVFPGFESKIAVRIVESGLSYGEARDLYITSYRQVMAGGDPQASWRRFVGKAGETRGESKQCRLRSTQLLWL